MALRGTFNLLYLYYGKIKIWGRSATREIKDTVPLMLSTDYKDRFIAEYWQTKIRYEELHDMLTKYEAGTLSYEPPCGLQFYRYQDYAMGRYLYDLELRAEIEQIPINSY